MPPELPDNKQRNPRHRVVAVMTRAQEDALHQLRRDGVPEGLALAVMQRISSLCLQTLRELDHVYREYEELLAADPDRSAAHQEWLETKTGGVLLMLESFIAELIAEALKKAKEDYQRQLSQPRDVPTIPARQYRPAWVSFLLAMTNLFVWVAGMVAAGVFAYQGTGMLFWAGIGFLIPFGLWFKLGSRGWGLVFPLIGIGLEAGVLYWLYVVEGGLQ
jgi:hypothetical protein